LKNPNGGQGDIHIFEYWKAEKKRYYLGNIPKPNIMVKYAKKSFIYRFHQKFEFLTHAFGTFPK